MKRRTVLGAWTVPVVMLATAAPARAASTPLPPACTDGPLTFQPSDPWGGNDSGPLWQTITVTNTGPGTFTLDGAVRHSTPHLTGVSGVQPDAFLPDGKGNATFRVAIPAGGSVVLRIEVTTGSDNDSAWLEVGCYRFHVKTVGKKDRL